MSMASTIIMIENILDIVIVVLPLIIFMIFLFYLNSFVPGEAKKIFVLLAIFTGTYFLAALSIEGFEILHNLRLYQGTVTEEAEESLDLVAHTLQFIGLCILFYVAIQFRSFAKKLEDIRR